MKTCSTCNRTWNDKEPRTEVCPHKLQLLAHCGPVEGDTMIELTRNYMIACNDMIRDLAT